MDRGVESVLHLLIYHCKLPWKLKQRSTYLLINEETNKKINLSNIENNIVFKYYFLRQKCKYEHCEVLEYVLSQHLKDIFNCFTKNIILLFYDFIFMYFSLYTIYTYI